jgi:tetratricopeptide (TPR) repeat protein
MLNNDIGLAPASQSQPDYAMACLARLWDELDHRPLLEIASDITTLRPVLLPNHLPLADLLEAERLRRIGKCDLAEMLLVRVCQCLSTAGHADGRWLARAWHSLGLTRRQLAEFDAAADAFLQALALDPRRSVTWYALQFTRLNHNTIAARIDRLEAVVELSKGYPLAWLLFSDWLCHLGRYQQGLAYGQRAVQFCVPAHQQAMLDPNASPTVPDALVLGAPKCGTTSFAAWLSSHPQLWVHPRKELHFFDNRWSWGENWYRHQFPSFQAENKIIRLEATPNYIQLPEAPERVFKLMPNARLIVLLREPLQRAVSWYHHMVRQEGLTKPIEQVICEELEGLEAMSHDQRRYLGWHGSNCLAGSLYDDQIHRWRQYFPSDQLLILRLEDIIGAPAECMRRIECHLGVDHQPMEQLQLLPKLNLAPAPHSQLGIGLSQRCLEKVLTGAHQLWQVNQLEC